MNITYTLYLSTPIWSSNPVHFSLILSLTPKYKSLGLYSFNDNGKVWTTADVAEGGRFEIFTPLDDTTEDNPALFSHFSVV